MERPLSLAVLACVASLSACGGFAARDGQFRCDVDGLCPAGQACMAGVCRVAGGFDAGAQDAGAIDAGAFDAAGTDAPVYLDARVDARSPDAYIGDGSWHFGRPHFVSRVHLGIGDYFGVVTSEDGQRLYVSTGIPNDPLWMYSRTDIGVPFSGTPTAVPGTAFADGTAIFVFSLTADELFLAVQVSGGAPGRSVLFFSRDTASGPFTDTTLVAPSTTMVHPSLSADGLELFYTDDPDGAGPMPRQVYRATRANPGESFPVGTGQALVTRSTADEASFPRVSRDGLMLFYSAPTMSYATRTALDTNFAGGIALPAPVELFKLPDYNPTTREMWMTSEPGTPWSPGFYATWRVQVCRGAPCLAASEPLVGCTSGARSDDGFHCYFLGSSATTFAVAAADTICGGDERGSRVATISSASENDIVRARAPMGGMAWIGLMRVAGTWRWANSEPSLYPLSWSSMGFDCATVETSTVLWAQRSCDDSYRPVCELEALPEWM